MTATSGGNVAKAEIRGIEGGGGFKVQFNPTNFQFDKQVQWKEHEEQGQEATLEFQKNSPANLSFELTFDTTGSDSDVRGAWVEPLLNLTKPEFAPQDGVASGLDKKRPPKVSFTWGEFVFLGVIAYELWVPARRSREKIETGATYWHLVDFLWVLIFALLYLMR